MSRFAYLRVDSDSDSSLGRSAACPAPPATSGVTVQLSNTVVTETQTTSKEAVIAQTQHATAPYDQLTDRTEQTTNDGIASDDGGSQLAQIAAAMTAITSPTPPASGAPLPSPTRTNLHSSADVQDDVLQSDSKTGASTVNERQGVGTKSTGLSSVTTLHHLNNKGATASSSHVVAAAGGDGSDKSGDTPVINRANNAAYQDRVGLPRELLQHQSPLLSVSSLPQRVQLSVDKAQRRDTTRDNTPLSIPVPTRLSPDLVIPPAASNAATSQPARSREQTADIVIPESPSSPPRKEPHRRVSPTYIVRRETDLNTTVATPQQSHVQLPTGSPTTPSLRALSEATPRRPRKATAGCGLFSFCRRPRRAGQDVVLFTARSAESAVVRQNGTAGQPEVTIVAGSAATEDISVLAPPEPSRDLATETTQAVVTAALAAPVSPPDQLREAGAGESVPVDDESPLKASQEVSMTSAPPLQSIAEPELEQRIAALEQALTLASEVVTVTTDTNLTPPPQLPRRHRRHHRHRTGAATGEAITTGLSPYPSHRSHATRRYIHHHRRRHRPLPTRCSPPYNTTAPAATASATSTTMSGQSASTSPHEGRRSTPHQTPTTVGPTPEGGLLSSIAPRSPPRGSEERDGFIDEAVAGRGVAVPASLAPVTIDAITSRSATRRDDDSQDDAVKGSQHTTTDSNSSLHSCERNFNKSEVSVDEAGALGPSVASAMRDSEPAVCEADKATWRPSPSPRNSRNTPERAGLTEAAEDLDQDEAGMTCGATTTTMELLGHRAVSHDRPSLPHRGWTRTAQMPAYQHRLLLDLRAREQRELDGLARSWRELTFHPQIHGIGGGGGTRTRRRRVVGQSYVTSHTGQTSISTPRSDASVRHPFARTPRGGLDTTRLRRSASVFNRLYRVRRERDDRSPAFADTPYSFTPQISPRARRLEARATVADVVARLYPEPARKGTAAPNDTIAVVATPPPSPSRDRVHRGGGKSVFDRLYEQRPQAVSLPTVDKREQKAAIYTFQPRITDMARRLSAHSPKSTAREPQSRAGDDVTAATNASVSLTIRTEECPSGAAEAQTLSSTHSSAAVELGEGPSTTVVSTHTHDV